jgi:hypothetical protein
MANTLQTIRTAIYNKLNTVLSGKVAVYPYYESDPSQYPCIIFDITNQQNDFLTNLENMSSITFKMTLLVQQVGNGTRVGLTEQEATNKLDALTDIIIDAIEDDFNLSGVVDYCIPTVGTREIMEVPNGWAKAQNINLVTKQSKFV